MGLFLRLLLLLLVRFQQFAGIFDGLVRGCVLPAEDFAGGFARAYPLFAKGGHLLVEEFQLPAGDEWGVEDYLKQDLY